MSITAEIKTYGQRCDIRQQLGARVITAIAAVYSGREGWNAARASGIGLVAAFSRLQAAREAQLAAERDYRDHIQSHACAGSERAKALSA